MKAVRKRNTLNSSKKHSGAYENSESRLQSDDEMNDESFDEYILENFVLFTGM